MSHENTRDLIDHDANRHVIRSLSTAATTLREHPIILLGVFLFVIVSDLTHLPPHFLCLHMGDLETGHIRPPVRDRRIHRHDKRGN